MRKIAFALRMLMIIALGAIMLFIGIDKIVTPCSQLIHTVCSAVTYPFLWAQQTIASPLHILRHKIETLYQADKRLAQLEQENQALLSQLVQVEAKVQVAAATEELRSFASRYDQGSCWLANILLKQWTDQEHFYIVAGGAAHGIKKDMVAVYKNFLVGRVMHVEKFYSKVLLITDRRSHIAAQGGSTKTNGIVQGSHDATMLSLTHVSHFERLQEGELLISSGQGLVFPQGFGLGIIEKFVVEGVHYTVCVKPLLDLRSLDYCYLLEKGQEQTFDLMKPDEQDASFGLIQESIV